MKYLRSQGKPKKKVLRDDESSGALPASKKMKPEFKQFPQIFSEPEIPPGEDEVSNARNQKMLMLEEKKLNPNKKTISVLMSRTFAFRRHDIMTTAKPFGELLKLYPSLKRVEQV